MQSPSDVTTRFPIHARTQGRQTVPVYDRQCALTKDTTESICELAPQTETAFEHIPVTARDTAGVALITSPRPVSSSLLKSRIDESVAGVAHLPVEHRSHGEGRDDADASRGDALRQLGDERACSRPHARVWPVVQVECEQ
eukprot:6176110-Pleurochrysis_carterae.AAC.1